MERIGAVQEGGAGGKLTRRSFRSQPTPYDRPPRPPNRDGWFSRLLRLPASRIIRSSLFSSETAHQHHHPPAGTPPPRIEQEGCDEASILDSDNQLMQSREPSASAETGCPRVISECRELVIPEIKSSYDGGGLAEIEQRLKQKSFSRDESNHLIELLRARTTGLSDHERGAAEFTVKAAGGASNQKDSISSAKETHATKSDFGISWNASESHQLNSHYEVGSSPVEIAKAYMQSLTSAPDDDGQVGKLVFEKKSSYNDESASKLSFPSAVKSPICWPGAVVHDNHGYFTPQTRIGRAGLCNISHTPYPCAVANSASKCQRIGGRSSNRSSARQRQSSTPVFGGSMAMKRRNSVFDDDSASIGSVWRLRQKNLAQIASEEAGSFNVGSSFSFLTESPDVLKSFLSPSQGNFKHGPWKAGVLKPQPVDAGKKTSGFIDDSSTVHPQSSEMARRILEHLDRTFPSPKEKLQELEMVVARTNTPPKADPLIADYADNIHDVSALNKHKTGCLLGKDVGLQENLDTQKQVVNVKFLGKDQLRSLPTEAGKEGILGSVNKTAISEVFHIPKFVPHSSCHGPISTPVSSTKPSEKLKPVGDFTFPVSLDPNAFTERPPTPTMASTVAETSRMPYFNEGTLPSFSFGFSNTNNRLTFSFENITSFNFADKSTPKFNFGTEKNCSLSFRMGGKYPVFCQ